MPPKLHLFCPELQNAAKIVSKAKSLVSLYKEAGVPAARLLMRIPCTYAGVQGGRKHNPKLLLPIGSCGVSKEAG